MRGRFITFEGGEGVGKTTQVERIRRRIEDAGQRVLVTREPGGSPRAERIREVLLNGTAKRFGPFAEAVLFSAARMHHVEYTIRPSLDAGEHVLCDRFADSTRVYQGMMGEVDEAAIAMLERLAVDGTEPDLTLVLDLPAPTGLDRARRRREGRGERADRFESEDPGFHEALRQGFLRIAREAPERCAVIDADREPDAVEAAIWAAIRERLPDLARAGGAVPHGA